MLTGGHFSYAGARINEGNVIGALRFEAVAKTGYLNIFEGVKVATMSTGLVYTGSIVSAASLAGNIVAGLSAFTPPPSYQSSTSKNG